MTVSQHLVDVFAGADKISASVHEHLFSGLYKFNMSVPYGEVFAYYASRDSFTSASSGAHFQFSLRLNCHAPQFSVTGTSYGRIYITEQAILFNSKQFDVPETEEDYFNLSLMYKIPLSLDDIKYVKSKLSDKSSVLYSTNMLIQTRME